MYLRLIRFAVVGVVATIVHTLTAYLLLENTRYNPLVINAGSYIIAVIFSVFAHGKWTFHSFGHANNNYVYVKVLISSLFTFVMSTVLIYVVINYVSDNSGLIVGCILLASISNFFIINHLTGKSVSQR